MITRFLILSALCVSNSCNAQFQIGFESSPSFSPMPVVGRYLDGISDVSTIFVYRNADEQNLSDFKKTLSSAWEINKLKFMSYEDFLNYQVVEGECYLTITSNSQTVYGSKGSVSHLSDFALSFWRLIDDRAVYFSYTQLYVPLEANLMVMEKGIESSNVIEKMYTELDVRNWNLGFLKTVFTDISETVRPDASRSYAKLIESDDLNQLKNAKLYISEDILTELHRFRREEVKNDNGDELTAAYPFPSEIVSNTEINEMTAAGEENYCLTFIRNSLSKFIVVYNTGTGEIMYAKMSSGFNFDKSDLRNLSKSISR